MKKLILLCLIFPCINICASEIAEDYLDIASNYVTYGKYTEASLYIDKILQLEPTNSKIKSLKEVLLRANNPNSKAYLSEINKNISEAQNYKKQGNVEKQISALSFLPNDFWTNYLLAQHYKDIGNYKNSIFYYEKALKIKPENSQCYLGLAQAYLEAGEFQKSINSASKYLVNNKNSDIAYAIRANARMNMNYYNEALSDIKKAISIDNNISYQLIEAKILYHKGDYYNAGDKFNNLSKNVQTSEVFKYLGLCDLAEKKLTSALLNINKAIILSDEDKSLNSTYNQIKSMLEKK